MRKKLTRMQQWSSGCDHVDCSVQRRGWYFRVWPRIRKNGLDCICGRPRQWESWAEPYSPPGGIRYTQASQLPSGLNLIDIKIDDGGLRFWLNKQAPSFTQPAVLSPTPVGHEPQSAHAGANFGQFPARDGAGDAPPSATLVTVLSPQAAAPSPSTLKSGNAGGRPRKWDLDAFAREMVQLANTLDGLPDRRATTEHIREWSASEWGCEPADSVLRDRIARLYPDTA